MNFYSIVLECNSFLLASSSRRSCRPFVIDGVTVGLIRPDFAPKILENTKVFAQESPTGPISFVAELNTVEKRSKELGVALQQWREQGTFECLKGWRGETYWVTTGPFNSKAVLTLERAGVAIFGFRSFGCHLNGYTTDPATGEIKLWIGRRSPTKQTWPNCLDNFVAGGLPYGMGIRENMVKECEEEAGLSPELAAKCIPAGAVSYYAEVSKGLSPEIQFVYDLELPPDFVPKAVDGEVANFYHWTVKEVMERMVTPEFKPNCALVLLDFFIRKGFITPDSEPRYLDLLAGMRTNLYQLDSLLTAPCLEE